MQPSLEELYQQNEFSYNTPDIPHVRVSNVRQGYSHWGAIAMSLEEWDRRGFISIDTRDLHNLGHPSLSEGDEIRIDDIHLLAFQRDWSGRSWVFVDADQPENHRWFMYKLALRSELDFKFALIWMMQDEAARLFPDIKDSYAY